MALSRFGLALSFALTAQGWSTYQQRIPNGANVMVNGVSWGGVGHLASGGGGARNDFGLAFQAAGSRWTTSLCQEDSDGDGETNGEELGDPSCTWTEGQSDPIKTSGTITHPGLAESNSIPPPVPVTPPIPVSATDLSPEESPVEPSPTSSPSTMSTVGPSVPLTNINPVAPTPPFTLVVSPAPVIGPVPSPPVSMQPGRFGSTPAPEDESSSVSLWLAMLIVLSVVAVALLAVLVACAYCKKKEMDEAKQDEEQDNPPLPNTDQWEGEGGQTSPRSYAQGQALDGREMFGGPVVPLQPGQKVRAMYLDGQTYDATIRSSGVDGSYAVEWYDGSYSEAVPQQHVTPINPLSNFNP